MASTTAPSFKILGIVDNVNACDCCGKNNLAKTVAIENLDEQAALNVLFGAWLRLKELGWQEAEYCPKDGSEFKVIEAGSTGFHDCVYLGEWPTGGWWVHDGDTYPSRPILWKPNGGAVKSPAKLEALARPENEGSVV